MNGAEMICYPGLRLQHQDCIPDILATYECCQKFTAAFFVLHSLFCVIAAVSSPMRSVDSNNAGFSYFAQLTLRHCAYPFGAPSLRHLPEIFALNALKNFLCCMFPDSESSFQPALLFTYQSLSQHSARTLSHKNKIFQQGIYDDSDAYRAPCLQGVKSSWRAFLSVDARSAGNMLHARSREARVTAMPAAVISEWSRCRRRHSA
jgi:hypothetical protein